MKKFVATILVLSSCLTMAACSSTSSTGDETVNAPYSDSRTAGGDTKAAPAERVFQQKQMK